MMPVRVFKICHPVAEAREPEIYFLLSITRNTIIYQRVEACTFFFVLVRTHETVCLRAPIDMYLRVQTDIYLLDPYFLFVLSQ